MIKLKLIKDEDNSYIDLRGSLYDMEENTVGVREKFWIKKEPSKFFTQNHKKKERKTNQAMRKKYKYLSFCFLFTQKHKHREQIKRLCPEQSRLILHFKRLR